MLTTEPPLGRRTASAPFDFDVLVAPALLPVEDLLEPAFAAVGVIVGTAYGRNKISVMRTIELGRNQRNGDGRKLTDEEFVGEATALLVPMVEVVTQFDVGGAG